MLSMQMFCTITTFPRRTFLDRSFHSTRIGIAYSGEINDMTWSEGSLERNEIERWQWRPRYAKTRAKAFRGLRFD